MHPRIKRAYAEANRQRRLVQAVLADHHRRLQIKMLLAAFLSIAFALLLTALGA